MERAANMILDVVVKYAGALKAKRINCVYAGVTQLAEFSICNRNVVGSTPISGPTLSKCSIHLLPTKQLQPDTPLTGSNHEK